MTPPPIPATRETAPGMFPMLDAVLALLVEHRAVLVRVPFVVAVGVVLATWLSPLSFTSSVAFVPHVDMSQMRGAGLAAQLGINLAGSDLTQSPDFYVSLVRSNTFLGELLDTPFSIPASTGGEVRTNLLSELAIEAPNRAVARAKAIVALREHIRVGTELKTGIVRITVSLPDRTLSWLVALRTVELINRFNDETRQSRGAHESDFLSGRVAEIGRVVRSLENEMQRFLDRNRTYESSAALRFEHDRMERELAQARTLQSQLLQQLDQARIERVRNTPLLTIVEPPIRAARPDRRYLAYRGVIAAVGSGVLLLTLLLMTETLRPYGTRYPMMGRTLDRFTASLRPR